MEEGGTSVDAGTVRRWLEAAAASLHEQRDYLTQLDAAIGDDGAGIAGMIRIVVEPDDEGVFGGELVEKRFPRGRVRGGWDRRNRAPGLQSNDLWQV